MQISCTIFYFLFTVLLCSNVRVHCDESVSESAAAALLEEINTVYRQSAAAYRQSDDDVLSPEILIRAKLRPYYEALQQYEWRNFKNAPLRRQFEVLLRGAKYPAANGEFRKATQTLKTMARKRWACARAKANAGDKCNLAFVHQIKSVFTNSDDLAEIQYYWQEWRNKMPAEIKSALHYYVGYYRNLSTPQLNASAVWYEQYEDAGFIGELTKLMETIRPLYRELHAHMRQVLRAKYGAAVVPPSGLIPHHLLEQVTYQAWKKETVLRNPFPQRKLPNLQAEMDEVSLKPIDLLKTGLQFFGSMGFPNLTDSYMQTHFIPMEAGSGGPDCKSRIYVFGDIELNYCPKVYYKKLLQTHGDIAQVQYALVRHELPVGLGEEACPGFGQAIGEAVILSASTPKHLQQRLGLLQHYEYDDLLNLNRLYRMGVHTLLTLPTYFVHERLWVDMLDGRVTPAEYNCRYWQLMAEHMGVQAPVQTAAGAYDMPYKFYEGIVDEQRSTKKLVGEFMGYQIYRALCLNISQFERNNAYKTLDNCDFASNRRAGNFLRNMMGSGSLKSWREVIQPLTFVRLTKLSATAFVEYYDSLRQWLSEDNESKNLRVGWAHTNTCKSGGTATETQDDDTVY